jgi:adenylyltransferase/sulfurtransferase
VIGSLQATETIKRILDIGQGLSGTLLIVDALDLHFQKIRIRKNPDCPLCSVSPSITSLASHRKPPPDPPPMSPDLPFEMDPAEVHLLLQSDPLSSVLDVREPYERAICRIDNSLDLPMGQVPGSLDQIPEDRNLFVLCHHGHRSARVVQFLRARGYERVVNIRGGIDAWSRTVDPKIPRY